MGLRGSTSQKTNQFYPKHTHVQRACAKALNWKVTYIHTHAYIYTGIHIHVCIHTGTHICIYTHAYIHTGTHIYTHIQIHSTHMLTHICTYTLKMV